MFANAASKLLDPLIRRLCVLIGIAEFLFIVVFLKMEFCDGCVALAYSVLETSDLVCGLGNLICEFRSVSILKLLLKVGYIPLERGNSFTVQCFLLLKPVSYTHLPAHA